MAQCRLRLNFRLNKEVLAMKRDFHGSIVIGFTFLGRARRAALSNALQDYGFPIPMYDIAMFVSRNPGTSQDSIAEMTCYDKATIARDAQKLEAQGYLIRKSCDRDRRQYELYLTELGNKLAADAFAAINDWTKIITKGLSQEKQDELLSILMLMASNLD